MVDYTMSNPMDAFFKTAGGLQQLQSNQQNMQQQQKDNQYLNQQRESQQQAQQKMVSAQQKAVEALNSGMPAQELAVFSMQNPEVGELLRKNLGLVAADKEQKYIQTTQAILANPDDVENILKDGFDMVPNSGDEDISTKALAKYREDPKSFLDGIEKTYSMLSPDGYKSFKTTKPESMTEFQSADLDIKRENTKLRALEAEARRAEQGLATETNELKRQELQARVEEKKLKVQEQQQKFDSLNNEKKAELTNAVGSASDTVAIVDRILNSPGFSAAVGAKDASSLFGLIKNPIAGTPAADTAALIDTLDAKNFLIAIQQMKGMGALSNAEGEKLSRAVQSLSRDQTEGQLKRNLEEIKTITSRAVETVRTRTGSDKKATVDAIPLQQNQAPQQAVDYLMQNPQFKEQFKAKYGYTPEGV